MIDIELVKEHIHEDLIESYDWATIQSNIVYDNSLDCYIIKSTDWVFYMNEAGELLQVNYNM